MVTVPTATQSGLGQVRHTGMGTTPTQSFRTSPDMFGSTQADNMSKAGAELTKQANDMIRVEDERASMEVEQEIRDWSFEATQGDNGVYRKLGGNAIGSTKSIEENYAKFSSELLKGRVVSSKARQRLERYIGERGFSMKTEVSRYEMGQKKTYDNGLRESRIKGAIEDAIFYSNDPEKFASSIAIIKSTNARNAAENGWSSEEATQQMQDDVSMAHKGTIQRLLDQKNNAGAASHLNRYKGEIDGDDIGDLESLVTSANEKSMVRENSSSVYDEFGSEYEFEGVEYINSKYEGKDKDKILSSYKRLIAQEKEQKTLKLDSVYDGISDIIKKGASPDDITAADELILKEGDMWNKVNKLFVQEQRGGLEHDDIGWLMDNYYNLSPAEQGKVPAVDLELHMSKDSFSTVRSERKKNTQPIYMKSNAEYLKSSIFKLGYDLSDYKKNGNDKKNIDELHKRVNEDVNNLMASQGSKITETQFRKVVDDLTTEIVIERSGWDINAPLLEWDAEDWYNTSIATGVPEGVLPSLIDAMQEHNLPITTQSIKKSYGFGGGR